MTKLLRRGFELAVSNKLDELKNFALNNASKISVVELIRFTNDIVFFKKRSIKTEKWIMEFNHVKEYDKCITSEELKRITIYVYIVQLFLLIRKNIGTKFVFVRLHEFFECNKLNSGFNVNRSKQWCNERLNDYKVGLQWEVENSMGATVFEKSIDELIEFSGDLNKLIHASNVETYKQNVGKDRKRVLIPLWVDCRVVKFLGEKYAPFLKQYDVSKHKFVIKRIEEFKKPYWEIMEFIKMCKSKLATVTTKSVVDFIFHKASIKSRRSISSIAEFFNYYKQLYLDVKSGTSWNSNSYEKDAVWFNRFFLNDWRPIQPDEKMTDDDTIVIDDDDDDDEDMVGSFLKSTQDRKVSQYEDNLNVKHNFVKKLVKQLFTTEFYELFKKIVNRLSTININVLRNFRDLYCLADDTSYKKIFKQLWDYENKIRGKQLERRQPIKNVKYEIEAINEYLNTVKKLNSRFMPSVKDYGVDDLGNVVQSLGNSKWRTRIDAWNEKYVDINVFYFQKDPKKKKAEVGQFDYDNWSYSNAVNYVSSLYS